MLRTKFLYFVIVTILSPKGIALILKGTAKDPSSGRVVYLEEHSVELDEKKLNKKINTRYFRPSGEVFATMESDFSKNPLIPEVIFQDFRFKKTEKMSISQKGEIQFTHVDNQNKENIAVIDGTKKTMVAAQGFDNFIKINFDEIQKRKVPMDFGVLSERKFFSFLAHTSKMNNTQDIAFSISMGNPFLRLFVDDLLVTYDSKTRLLKSFQGLSNILDEKQQKQVVKIDYEVLAK